MASRDLHNNIHIRRAISPAAAVTDNTAMVSQICDTAGYESVELVLASGSLADVDATFTLLLEHGDASNLSDAAAVPDADLLGTEAVGSFTFADDDEPRKLGYVGTKRYLRATVTPANNAGNAFISAVWVLANARHKPTPTLT